MGRVAGAYGVRGWVKVDCEPERLAAHRHWRVGGAERAVERAKVHSGTLLAKLGGIESREQAEALKGAAVEVPRDFPPRPASLHRTTQGLQSADRVHADSPGATFLVVDDRVDLTVTYNGPATVDVTPSANNQVLPFTLTNTGNATHGYLLTTSVGAGALTMNNVRIYVDVDQSGTLNGPDTLYTAGTNVGDIAPDAFIRLLIVADPGGRRQVWVGARGQRVRWVLVQTRARPTVSCGPIT